MTVKTAVHAVSKKIRFELFYSIALCLLCGGASAYAQSATGEPLPSWNEGPAKKAIIAFVKKVTTEGGPDFVPVEDRIATFDNDGTLWCEFPLAEAQFALARLRAMAEKDPSLRERQPYKAALEGDVEYISAAGARAVLELITATHTNESESEYENGARAFLGTAKHPRFGAPYTHLTYRPMIELLDYLRANGFKTFICTGGEIDFVRTFSRQIYGIPTEQVIGSHFEKEWIERDGKRVIWRKPKLLLLNDKDLKPVGISMHIGKRPIFVAGNVRSVGDIGQLRYSQETTGPSFQLLINHDDAEREYAYREKDNASLNAARKNGWTVVSMKDDWKTVFNFQIASKAQ